jgi:hypothetical protein
MVLLLQRQPVQHRVEIVPVMQVNVGVPLQGPEGRACVAGQGYELIGRLDGGRVALARLLQPHE